MTIPSNIEKYLNQVIYKNLPDQNGFINPTLKKYVDLTLRRVVLNDLKKLNISNSNIEIFDIYRLCSPGQVLHVTDWLMASIVNNEPWLSNLDDLDRPKKLMKFSSVEQIIKEADKAMLIASQKASSIELNTDKEKTIAQLEDNYSIVQLLSVEALDRESSFMQHCIGNGGYDERVKSDKYKYLSLRDPAGKPHVTIEAIHNPVTERFDLRQIQGKQNKTPISKYTNYLLPFLEDQKFGLDPILEKSFPYVIDKFNVWHDYSNLPPILKCNTFAPFAPLHTKQSLMDEKSSLRLPEKVLLADKIHIASKKIYGFPEKMIAEKESRSAFTAIDLSSIEFHETPSKLYLKGDTTFSTVSFNDEIDEIVVDGKFSLSLSSTSPFFFKSIEATKSALIYNFTGDQFDCKVKSKEVVIWDCHAPEIKSDFILDKSLTIMKCPDVKTLTGKIDVQELILMETGIQSLPEDIKVSKSITLDVKMNLTSLPDTIDDDVIIHWKQVERYGYAADDINIPTVGAWRAIHQNQLKM